MKRVVMGVVAVVALACSSSKEEQRKTPAPDAQVAVMDAGVPVTSTEMPDASPPAATPAPAPTEEARATGKVTVKGGEVFSLKGAQVLVKQVTYLNQPCPKGAKCLHSGVIKSVQFVVTRDGGDEAAVVTSGEQKVTRGVMLRVHDVREGPEADVEAQLPLGS
ncbi:MAG: hypothetical protein AB2A00_04285 [Myxococcota bacterium]